MREIVVVVRPIRFIVSRYRFWVPGSLLRSAPE